VTLSADEAQSFLLRRGDLTPEEAGPPSLHTAQKEPIDTVLIRRMSDLAIRPHCLGGAEGHEQSDECVGILRTTSTTPADAFDDSQ